MQVNTYLLIRRAIQTLGAQDPLVNVVPLSLGAHDPLVNVVLLFILLTSKGNINVFVYNV